MHRFSQYGISLSIRQYGILLAVFFFCSCMNSWSQELKTPQVSKHFTRWVDPESGAVSYVLKSRVAPQQQSFYFVNRSMSEDGRFLWFYCLNPPSTMRTIGLVDFKTDEIFYFPEVHFRAASPYVDQKTGDLYWSTDDGVYYHPSSSQGVIRKISGVPECFSSLGQRVYQLACHLTLDNSGTRLFLDARVDNKCISGDMNIATGEFTEWGRTDPMLNHAQFNPVDDNLVLICKEFWNDAVTGKRHGIPANADGVYERLWLWRKGEDRKLVPPINNGKATHEWWAGDGRSFFYCAYPETGIACYDLKTGEQRFITRERATHGHSSLDSRYYVFDQSIGRQYRGCAWKVFFYNSESGKNVCIVTNNPEYNTPENPSKWHPDPHPQIVANDRYVVSTLNIDGAMNVLVTPVEPLVELTK